MSSQEVFLAAARKCLSVEKKSLSVAVSMDLAAQVLAVDLGLKPALLYDSNSANAQQVQQYLTSLQSAQLLSNSVLTLAVGGNALIMNPVMVIPNLERLLHGNNITVINVCHSLEKPSITDPLSGELRSMAQDLLVILREFVQQPEVDKPLYVEEVADKWNLCTLFGIVLGFPATYWFDQNRSFENCLAMTPLVVTKASVTWQVDTGGHRSCLYSFSIPAVLHTETWSTLEEWNLRLKERFQQQTVFSDLIVSQSVVTLPSVCL